MTTRIALVGCGIIANSHARAMVATGAAECTALFDVDASRAEALRRTLFPAARVLASADEVAGKADAAIVATPAGTHAALSIALLDRGVHVLCEKPLATTLEDAEAMVAAADRASRVLVCGLVRRFSATTGLVQEALEADLVGKPVRVEVWESVVDWPMPKHCFDRALSGGGAFFDVGPHVLDLLGLWLGSVEVVAYEDDAVGGVEAVGRAHLVCRGAYGDVPATVLLSRGLQTSNRTRIVCARGTIEVVAGRPDAVQLTFGARGGVHWLSGRTSGRDPFALQLEHFVRAASGVHVSHVPNAAAVRTIALVEQCYRARRPLPSAYAEQLSPPAGDAVPLRKVLLTGANGHVGMRLVEMWEARGDLGRLRCMLRSRRNAAPVLRYPAEVVDGDLLDPASITAAAAGCDAIVHLAVGTHAAQEAENLARVAKELGIRRFVHMSSAAVYGRDMPAFIERLQEGTPLKRIGEPYADAKTAAEWAVLRAREAIDAVILRPHIVFGPAQRWSILMVDTLRRGALAAVEDSGWCNLIYVDDLVRAVDRALVTREGVGHAFFITDGRPRRWSEIVLAHARLVGSEPGRARAADVERSKHAWVRSSAKALGSILVSSQVKSLILGAPPLHDTVVPLYRALKKVGALEAYVARRQARANGGGPPGPDADWTSLQLSEARLSGAAAQAKLGFSAAVGFEAAMERTAAWLAFFGHVDEESLRRSGSA